MLDIACSDPEHHKGTTTTLSFVDFKVSTSTDDSRFQQRSFFVRRRYRDFVWLRNRLTIAFPGAIVPPIPPADKPYKGEINRFAPEFIARRQAGLELFLRRVPRTASCARQRICSPSSKPRCGSYRPR